MTNKRKIWLSAPHMGGDEWLYVQNAFETNWIAPLGPHVDGFEEDLCAFTGTRYAAAVSSGTAAIHLALILLGINSGDEVICSTFTFAASANPIVYQSAKPVFVDSETQTWNMSPEFLEQAIRDRIKHDKKPAAIIIVHLYGMPAQMNSLLDVARRHEIPVIEDAAEALGSRFGEHMTGTMGTMGVLSFNGNKIISTSGGGALLSDEGAYITQARHLSTQARDQAPHYEHSQVGYNYRMSNVCAAIGRGQMKVLPERIRQRRHNFEYYRQSLGDLPGIGFLDEPDGLFSNRWLSCIVIDPALSGGVTREQLRLALEKENVDARPLWKPLHTQPVFAQCHFYGDGTSERLFHHGLCLPSSSSLSEEDLALIVRIIRNQFEHRSS